MRVCWNWQTGTLEGRVCIACVGSNPTTRTSLDVNEPGMLARQHGVIPAYRMSLPIILCKMAYLFERGYKYEELLEFMNKNLKGELLE